MRRDRGFGGRAPSRARAWASALLVALACAGASSAFAASTGRVQGKVVAAESGEPIAFADVLLLPVDTTMARVGVMTNADGTFALEAAAGRYTLQVRAISYERKRVEDVVIEAGGLLPLDVVLHTEALEQKGIEVEAKSAHDTEASLLAERRKAATVEDAVSAEQVRRSSDKNAAEVLRRVTGLTVTDGKYVFVRGLGERYSSTEVDGVRIASPEQNKRVVPLDLLPASLLEDVVVQKTYTADRPGEFGGGDVQVRTRDFPGHRTWSLSVSQGYNGNVTFREHRTYASTKADVFGFGAGARRIPGAVGDAAGGGPLVLGNPAFGPYFTRGTLASVARSFLDVWSPTNARTPPNAGYSLSYGDEFKVFGRPLGLIESWSFSRSFDQRDESQRLFAAGTDTSYDYAVSRATESVQLGGISGLSLRLSPRHTLHLRGLYANSADDEVRVYEGQDHNRVDATTGEWITHRDTRLLYVQRDVRSGTLEGQHEFPHLLGSSVDWRLTRSSARREQPDRRETTYDLGHYLDANGDLVSYWALASFGSREYGDLRDNGWGATLSGAIPFRLGGLGSGSVVLGIDRQRKDRRNFYRRFDFHPSSNVDRTLPPDSIFAPGGLDGSTSSGYVDEATLDIDNYRATQLVTAAFLSADLPLGRRMHGRVGVRAEHGIQDVQSFDLFDPARVTQHGGLDHADWLPSANLTFALLPVVNVRAAASRTLSRPDLNEMSPSPALDYVGGMRVAGNPDLDRALIDNYDVRIEAFPSLSEVFAAGFFLKELHQPIEQVIQGGSPPLLVPRDSDHGHNFGVELEARSRLDRLWRRLASWSVNANATIVSSRVYLAHQITELGTPAHPLQGQANIAVNGALAWTSKDRMSDLSLQLGMTGRRLRELGLHPLPDVYEQPSTSLDVAMNLTPFHRARVKLTARNLLDPRIRELQGGKEASAYRAGRSFSVALVLGS